MRHAVAYWLRHCATSRKVAGSRTYEVNEFFPNYLILPAALGPGVTQPLTEMSISSIHIMFLGSKMRPGLTNLPQSVSRLSNNVGSVTSHNPIGLHGLLRG
jgi:hypothetical protein